MNGLGTGARDCVGVMMVVRIPFHRYAVWSNVLDIFADNTLSISMTEVHGHQSSFRLVYRCFLRTAHGHSLVSIGCMLRLGSLHFAFERKMLQIEIEWRKEEIKENNSFWINSMSRDAKLCYYTTKRLLRKKTQNFVSR